MSACPPLAVDRLIGLSESGSPAPAAVPFRGPGTIRPLAAAAPADAAVTRAGTAIRSGGARIDAAGSISSGAERRRQHHMADRRGPCTFGGKLQYSGWRSCGTCGV